MIGISAYSPLAEGLSLPNAETIDRAWDGHLRAIDLLSKRRDRPVVFFELGYDLGTNADRTPWIRGDGQPGGDDLQELCLERALLAVDRSEPVIGAFLWKWFPGNTRREDYQIQRPGMRETVRKSWIGQKVRAENGPAQPDTD